MKKITVLLLLTFAIISCKKEVPYTIGDFSFSSEKITQNQPFTISYNGKDSLQDSFYYLINKTYYYAYDLDFKNNTTTITIPDSITAVAFNFKANDKYFNNNKKGFLFNVVDKNGNQLIDSEASLQYYSFNIGEDYDIISNEETTLNTIETALKTEPNLTKDWIENHVYIASYISEEKGEEVSNNYITKYTKPNNLEDFEALYKVYKSIENTAKADSILEIVTSKFPKSDLAIQKTINAFLKSKSLTEKQALFNANKQQLLKSNYGRYIAETLAYLNYNEGNYDAFQNYANLITKKTKKASFFNNLAWSKAEKGIELDRASALSKTALQLIKEEQTALKEKPNYFTKKQYIQSLEGSHNMYADTYAYVLFKQDKIKEAIKYQDIAISGKYPNAEMQERYVQYLMADNQLENVVTKASKFIEEGNSTENLTNYFLEALQKTGNTNGEQIVVDLKQKAKLKGLKSLKKKLIDEEAPDFNLKNLKGETVSLSALKGKIVVLDFWATWCSPCIASFPAMQKVVDKYKDNSNVSILFINTFEDEDNRIKNVEDFIKKNNYTFNVPIDPIKSGNKYLVANQYNVSGIPTKVVIGKDGRLKYKSVGFSGSAEKTVTEIDNIIELLESNP